MTVQPMHSLTEALLASAVAARRRRATNELRRFERELEQILRTVAHVIAVLSQGRWTVEDEHPGYLTRKLGSSELWVPWSLAAEVAADDDLAELVRIAVRIRTSPEATMCVSGSAALFKAAQPIADLDFCEYLPARRFPAGALRAAATAALARDGDGLFWLDLKLWDELNRKWKEQVLFRAASPQGRSQFLDIAVPRARQGKWTFAALTTLEGVIELTIMALVTPDAQERSDAYQEIAITLGGVRPRALVSAAAIGRYFERLRSEVRKQCEASRRAGNLLGLVKAAKRLFSMALLLQMPGVTRELRRRLASGLAVRAALEARAKLLRDLDRLPESDPVKGLTGPLRQKVEELSVSSVSSAPIPEEKELRGMLLTQLGQIEEAYDRVERRLLSRR